MQCLIPLGKYGKSFAIIDEEDKDLISGYRWSRRLTKMDKAYAACTDNPGLGMHMVIMGTVGTKMLVDHKNHDGLDNRRCNLRIATKSQNCSNRRSARGSSSKYLGVSKSVSRKGTVKWSASISKMKKVMYSGRFDSEIEAAKAYNEWAKEVHGEFANLNVIEENG